MAIRFHPKPGMVLSCDLRGSVPPEISKIRPVAIITPRYLRRTALATIVPLSTKRPHLAGLQHVRLSSRPYSGSAWEVWAKCDLAMSVSYARLDRIELASGQFITGFVSGDDLQRIYVAVAYAFGLDGQDARR